MIIHSGLLIPLLARKPSTTCKMCIRDRKNLEYDGVQSNKWTKDEHTNGLIQRLITVSYTHLTYREKKSNRCLDLQDSQ